ncbi:hypothetical protein LSH36_1592g00036 [Paralvinella palmiformis]|uniref:EGF-like domain-containing protein n=1 Tax=Paralvinella palmiformis TaxID=53620 RepID=A0AAD9ISF8_9ANNE|nr:hypothetical protein LSH36_1592g00036 [Paralvinella palmiformis]
MIFLVLWTRTRPFLELLDLSAAFDTVNHEILLHRIQIRLGISIRYCRENTDCESLGDLFCVKSMCNWGVCACSRGYAARFVGSEKNFRCVKIKKIGEKCSTDQTEGVCGAENSHCVDGRCQCNSGTEPRWGGETCLPPKTTTISESCSAGIGTCQSGQCVSGLDSLANYGGVPMNLLANSPWDKVPNTCACPIGFTASLPNGYDVAPSMGKKQPVCRPNAVGDLCFRDADCSQIRTASGHGGWTAGGARCINNQCSCSTANTSYKYDITGLYCATGLGLGDACAWYNDVPNSTIGICDGSVGLRCGNPCDLSVFDGSGNHSCVCDPGWKSGGGKCNRKVIGDSCYGDQNCKSIDYNAICVEGVCQSTAIIRQCSGMLLIFVAMVTVLVP